MLLKRPAQSWVTQQRAGIAHTRSQYERVDLIHFRLCAFLRTQSERRAEHDSGSRSYRTFRRRDLPAFA